MELTTFLYSLLPLVIGASGGWYVRNRAALVELKVRQDKGDSIIEKAKAKASETLYNARKEAKEVIREEQQRFDRRVHKKENEIKRTEQHLEKKESKLEAKIEDRNREIERIRQKEKDAQATKEKLENEIHKYHKKQEHLAERLVQVSGMSKEEIKKELKENMLEEAKVDFARELKRLEEEFKGGSGKQIQEGDRHSHPTLCRRICGGKNHLSGGLALRGYQGKIDRSGRAQYSSF